MWSAPTKMVSYTMAYKLLLFSLLAVLCGKVMSQPDGTVNVDKDGMGMNSTSGDDMSHSHQNMNTTSNSHGNMTNSHGSHGNMSTSHGNMASTNGNHGNMTTSHGSHGNMSTSNGNMASTNGNHGNMTTPHGRPGNMNSTTHNDHSTSHTGHGNANTASKTDSDHSGHQTVNKNGDSSHSGQSGGAGGHSGHSATQLAGHYGVFHMTYDTVILFSEWTTKSWQHMLYSCLGIGVFAAFYEGLKTFREWVCVKTADALERKSIRTWNRLSCGNHVFQMFLHMLQVLWSYLLMLVFMTFNIYLCASVILGAGAGFLIFRWKTPRNRYTISDLDEHCM